MSVLPIGSAIGALWPPPAATETASQAGPSSVGLTGPTAPTSPMAATGAGSSAGSAGGGFAGVLGNALNSLQGTQATADNLATQAATGSLTNVADYMVAAEQANIQTQLTAAVRNSALQAFQQIMGMQL
jgi:flagellar hook-basal body complex protein FliE